MKQNEYIADMSHQKNHRNTLVAILNIVSLLLDGAGKLINQNA